MTAVDASRVTLADRGRNARQDALARLMEIAYDDPARYDPARLVAHGTHIAIVIRDALCRCHRAAPSGPLVTCGRCTEPTGDINDRLLAEVTALAPVAAGQTLAVMDVVSEGRLPEPPDEPEPLDMAALTAALTEWATP